MFFTNLVIGCNTKAFAGMLSDLIVFVIGCNTKAFAGSINIKTWTGNRLERPRKAALRSTSLFRAVQDCRIGFVFVGL